MWKVCRILSPYPNAYAKVQKLIFDVHFPGNCFEFGIILNDFWSSTIWSIQIQVSRTESENPENPGIQPTNAKRDDSKCSLNLKIRESPLCKSNLYF